MTIMSSTQYPVVYTSIRAYKATKQTNKTKTDDGEITKRVLYL